MQRALAFQSLQYHMHLTMLLYDGCSDVLAHA